MATLVPTLADLPSFFEQTTPYNPLGTLAL
jgi:hypothetical protein